MQPGRMAEQNEWHGREYMPDAGGRTVLSGDQGWLWLGGVVAVHALLLAVALMGMGRSVMSVTQPALIGKLVSATPPGALASPRPQPDSTASSALPSSALRELTSARTDSRPPATAATPQREVHSSDSSGAAIAPATPAGPPAHGPVTPPRTDAAHLNNPAPAYPALSRRFGEQGRVLFDVYILRDGSVGEIRLKRSSGFSRLDAAAHDAVRRWRYVPAHRGSEPIPYWYVQPITFSLDS